MRHIKITRIRCRVLDRHQAAAEATRQQDHLPAWWCDDTLPPILFSTALGLSIIPLPLYPSTFIITCNTLPCRPTSPVDRTHLTLLFFGPAVSI